MLIILRRAGIWLVMFGVIGTPQARAISYGFFNVSGAKIPGDISDQIFIDVQGLGADRVLFTFRNLGPNQGRIADVSFEDVGILSYPAIINDDDGVDFTFEEANRVSISPMSQKFQNAFAFTKKRVAENGVDAGEILGLKFTGKLDRVIGALNDGSLRVGVHLTGLEGKPDHQEDCSLRSDVNLTGVVGSPSCQKVMNNRVPVPEPPTTRMAQGASRMALDVAQH